MQMVTYNGKIDLEIFLPTYFENIFSLKPFSSTSVFISSELVQMCLNKLLSFLDLRLSDHGTFNVVFKISRRENQVVSITAVACIYCYFVVRNHHLYLLF